MPSNFKPSAVTFLIYSLLELQKISMASAVTFSSKDLKFDLKWECVNVLVFPSKHTNTLT
jgi:hypothetical protein